jgi:hypothetical protein
MSFKKPCPSGGDEAGAARTPATNNDPVASSAATYLLARIYPSFPVVIAATAPPVQQTF